MNIGDPLVFSGGFFYAFVTEKRKGDKEKSLSPVCAFGEW